MRGAAAVLLALLLAGATARAEDNPHAGPLALSVTGGAVGTFAGDTKTATLPIAFIEADGPLAFGTKPIARVFGRIGITTEPGDNDISASYADASTYSAVEAGLGLYRIFGACDGTAADCPAEGQFVTSAVAVEAGFSNKIAKEGEKPAERFSQHYGIGLRLGERRSGSSITVLYGRDEAAGDFGVGQLMAYAAIPLFKNTAGEGVAIFTIDATVNLLHKDEWTQRDIARLGFVLDFGAILGKK